MPFAWIFFLGLFVCEPLDLVDIENVNNSSEGICFRLRAISSQKDCPRLILFALFMMAWWSSAEKELILYAVIGFPFSVLGRMRN